METLPKLDLKDAWYPLSPEWKPKSFHGAKACWIIYVKDGVPFAAQGQYIEYTKEESIQFLKDDMANPAHSPNHHYQEHLNELEREWGVDSIHKEMLKSYKPVVVLPPGPLDDSFIYELDL